MQSAVNKKHTPNQAKAIDEDILQESIDNLDMLLANMKAGVSAKERALNQLGEKFNLKHDQNIEPITQTQYSAIAKQEAAENEPADKVEIMQLKEDNL